MNPTEGTRERELVAIVSGLIAVFGVSVWILERSLPAALVMLSLSLLVYTIVAWRRVLSSEERQAWMGMLLSFKSPARTAVDNS
jgi:hypothetical protein